MMAVTEPGVHVITLQCCTQLMKTAFLENVFGYFAHLDPCPMLLLQPKEDAAEQFSKERITPMLRVTPVLRDLVGTSKTRDAEETLLFKGFPGGFLALAGAGSPDNLARRPIRVLLADEVDKYPVTREGDPIALAEERTATFGANWLSARACSPTIADESRIEALEQKSDQRRASLECPHCGHRQFPDFFKHVHWPKDGENHRPEEAQLYCEACGCAWTEGQRLRALATTRWHQTRPFMCCDTRQVPLDTYEAAWRAAPEGAVDRIWDWWAGGRHAVYRARCAHCGEWAVPNQHAGFQAGKLFSPWPKDRPADIAVKWLDAGDDEDLKQAWWNTQQGLAYRPHVGRAIDVEGLSARVEIWDAEIPDGVAMLTAGGDVQDDRVELEIVGWGHNEESWSIAHEVVEGDPDTLELWDRVDAVLKRSWRRADGRAFTLKAACIDSGGHHTQRVYEFCKARLGRHVWAVKGESARNGQRSPVWPNKRPTRANKAGFRPVIIGVNAAKDVIRSRLQLAPPPPGQRCSGYMHFPADRDLAYFKQLVSERLVTRQIGAVRFRVWELPRGAANEALDLRVYAYAALCGLFHFGLKLNRLADSIAPAPKIVRQLAAVAAALRPPGERPAVTGPIVAPAASTSPPTAPRRRSMAELMRI